MKKKNKVIVWNERIKKDVSRGFFKNYLLTRHLALPLNKKNIVWNERIKENLIERNLELEKEKKELFQKINETVLFFELKKNEKGNVFGSVSFKEVLEKLVKEGINLKKQQLVDFRPLREIGKNNIKIKLNDLSANLKIIIT